MGRRRRARAGSHPIPAGLWAGDRAAGGRCAGLVDGHPGRGGALPRAGRQLAGGGRRCGGCRPARSGGLAALVGGGCSGAGRGGPSVAVERLAHRLARDSALPVRAHRGARSGLRRAACRLRGEPAGVGPRRAVRHVGRGAACPHDRAGGGRGGDGAAVPHRPPCLGRSRHGTGRRRRRDGRGADPHRHLAGGAAERSCTAGSRRRARRHGVGTAAGAGRGNARPRPDRPGRRTRNGDGTRAQAA